MCASRLIKSQARLAGVFDYSNWQLAIDGNLKVYSNFSSNSIIHLTSHTTSSLAVHGAYAKMLPTKLESSITL
ncbi:hypothetical protein Plhal304r1_c047g0128901 [Plasmopara halstedii]